MDIASFIDHTVLKPDTTKVDVARVCNEAQKYHFAAVCVPPYFVDDAVRILENSKVKVATVIGFPMGYSSTPSKVEEIKRAIDHGVDELDVVINISALKSGDWNHVESDIDSMTRATHLQGKTIKVIIETGVLTNEEIVKACKICAKTEVDYVKTSTGFNGKGASVEIVKLMRKNLPQKIKIKASGGIGTKKFAEDLIKAGVDRIGASKGVKIVNEN